MMPETNVNFPTLRRTNTSIQGDETALLDWQEALTPAQRLDLIADLLAEIANAPTNTGTEGTGETYGHPLS